MLDRRPSLTATAVAFARTLGGRLPPTLRLATDPFGASFAGRPGELVARHLPRVALGLLYPLALHMQVRTRAIDDVLRGFVASGGRQIVILGAGFDCRAERFAAELAECHVYEVDHPATQARKRRVLDRIDPPSAPVSYVAWDFETRPVAELPNALAALGHRASQPTLTVWEGVTMYLTAPAIHATVEAVRRLSATGSTFVVNYFDRRELEHPDAIHSVMTRSVAWMGEPFRFGWIPAELPGWFGERGFDVEWDRSLVEIARSHFGDETPRVLRREQTRIAVLRARDQRLE